MRRSFVLAVVMLTLAAPSAWALPQVSLVWTATTGTGTPGGDTIVAVPGDDVTLDIVAAIDPMGFTGASISLEWTAGATIGGAAVECPAPPNLVAGQCTSVSFLTFSPLSPGVTVGVDTASSFDVVSLNPEFTPSSMTLGRMQFTVVAEDRISVFYLQGEGLQDGAFVNSITSLPEADIIVLGLDPTETPDAPPSATDTPEANPTATADANGALCVEASDCQSGFCTDGVCCDAACDGQNEMCDLSGRTGECTLACACADIAAPSPSTSGWALMFGVLTLATIARLGWDRTIARS